MEFVFQDEMDRIPNAFDCTEGRFTQWVRVKVERFIANPVNSVVSNIRVIMKGNSMYIISIMI